MISLIISVYKNIKYLDLVLNSINDQTYSDFEVIIAEDCNEKKMVEYIRKKRKKIVFKLNHIFQEDIGFRKNRILNKAIKESNGDYLIFIDGDCILHKNYLREYAKYIKENVCLYGRRVMLDEQLTKCLLHKNKKLNILNIYLSNSRKKEEGLYIPFFGKRKKEKGIVGSNFGINKKILYEINGFDEDYKNACIGEDVDLEMRMKKYGKVEFMSLKNKAIQYHLYHERIERKTAYEINKKLYENKINQKNYKCLNGLIKL